MVLILDISVYDNWGGGISQLFKYLAEDIVATQLVNMHFT